MDPVLGQLLPEPYQPFPKQPGGIGTPVTDPVQKPDEKTGMFTAGCGHWFNNYNIQQSSIASGSAPYGSGNYGDNGYGVSGSRVAVKLACCPLCGYVQQILPVATFDNDPFTFIAILFL
jgi:hypothetical protein